MTHHQWLIVGLLISGACCGGCGSSEVKVQTDGLWTDGTAPASPTPAQSIAPQVASASSGETGSDASASGAQADSETEEPIETESLSGISWEKIDGIYGLKSTVSNIEKQSLWNSLKGKQVEWTGQVGEMSIQFGLPAVEVKMDRSSSIAEVLLHVKKRSEAAAQTLKKNDAVTFSGELTAWGTVVPIVTLGDVQILTPHDLARRAERERAAKIAAANAAKAQADDAALVAAREREAIESKHAEEEARQAKREHSARMKLNQARKLFDSDRKDIARKWFQEVANDYPDTEAGVSAKNLLRLK